MKHIFIFQGKKYISSKRASKISDYSSDYIGQLCRAGKLDCRMIGHGWFVTEESLKQHASAVLSSDFLKNRIQNLRPNLPEIKEVNSSSELTSVPAPLISGAPERISTKSASEISGYTSDYIGQLCRGGKIDGKRVGNTWLVTERSLRDHMDKIKNDPSPKSTMPSKDAREVIAIRYSHDEGPALPEISKAAPQPLVLKKPVQKDVGTEKKTYSTIAREIILKRAISSIVATGVVAVAMVISITGIGSSGKNNTSSAILGQQKISTVQNTYRGLAVAPATGSLSSDDQLKAEIQDSFSDQVDVQADRSGTAGVITPVFKQTNGKDFIYVMVPVKDKQASNN